MVATSSEESEYFIYEICFYRSVTIISVKRMFPECVIEPVRQIFPSRLYVTYDAETNTFSPIPLNDM